MKITGSGGEVTKDAVALASVASFSFAESGGNVYGQKQSDISLKVYIDSTTAPLRQGDVFDLVLTVGGASWNIAVDDCEVLTASIGDVSSAGAAMQELTLIGRKTATIA